MNNINYPVWKSGIPELLPINNPFVFSNPEEYPFIPGWYENKFRGKIIKEATTNTNGIDIKIRDAWSYMEILKWLREKYKYHIKIDYQDVFSICYIGYVKNKEGDEEIMISKNNYEQALDEAILYCLKLIKENE